MSTKGTVTSRADQFVIIIEAACIFGGYSDVDSQSQLVMCD